MMYRMLMFFMLASWSLTGQITMEGMVMDPSQQPIAYANIFAEGVGTMSDSVGHFELVIPSPSGTLVVTASFLGYVKDEQTITQFPDNGLLSIDFILTPDDNMLETAVITAGRYEQPLSKTTVSLAVLQPKLLASTNTIALDDALNRLSGVDVIDGQANIRGGSGYSYGAGSRVLLLLDGMPIMQTDAAFPNWNDMPIENVGQVEILKGAASSLYGSSAMNGIVNIRTAVPTPKPYLRIAPFYTTYFSPKDETQKWWDKSPYSTGLSAVFRQRIKKLGLSAGGYFLNEEGYKKDTYKKYGRAFLGLDYHLSEKVEFGIHTYYNPGETATFFFWNDDTTGIYQPAPNTSSMSKRSRINIDPYVKISDKFGNRHKIQGRFLQANNENSGGQGNNSTMVFGEYQFSKQFTQADLVLIAGVATTQSQVTAELYGDTSYTSSNNAAYLQLEKTFFEQLTISGGLRYEANVLHSPEVVEYSVFGVPVFDTIPGGVTEESKPVFRVGLNWHAGKATYFRASFGQGYRYPTIAEKFISTSFGAGIPILPNPTLHSETGNSIELGIKQGFQFNQVKGFLDVSVFQSEYKDMMEFSLGGRDGHTLGFSSINIGQTQIRGAELTVAGKGKTGPIRHQMMVGYMYLDPKYVDFSNRIKNSSTSEENILKYRFRNSWKMDWELSFKPVSLGLSAIHNSETIAVDVALEESIEGAKHFRMEHKGFTRWDLRTSWKVNNQIKLSLVGQNITNLAYSQRVGKLEAPFNLSFRVDMMLLD